MAQKDINMTFYHKHNYYVSRYDQYDDKLTLECQFNTDNGEYTLDITPSDLVKYRISSVDDLLDFISMHGFNTECINKCHILAITSDEAMKEMAELFHVFDYWKVLSVIQNL